VKLCANIEYLHVYLEYLFILFWYLKICFLVVGASIPMNQNGSLFQYLVSARANANEVQLLTFFSATDRVTKDKDFLSHDPDSTNWLNLWDKNQMPCYWPRWKGRHSRADHRVGTWKGRHGRSDLNSAQHADLVCVRLKRELTTLMGQINAWGTYVHQPSPMLKSHRCLVRRERLHRECAPPMCDDQHIAYKSFSSETLKHVWKIANGYMYEFNREYCYLLGHKGISNRAKPKQTCWAVSFGSFGWAERTPEQQDPFGSHAASNTRTQRKM
jgi:hypothetical protein